MAKIFFHPDIDYQDILLIEEKYNSQKSGTLIKKAVEFIYQKISTLLTTKKSILFICGPGTNGLDGMYTAIKLISKKYNVKILLTDKSSHGNCIKKYNISSYITDNNIKLSAYDYIVDCIFGYGLNRELNTYYTALISSINNSDSFIISIDVPSGLDSFTGNLLPVGVKCNLLVSLMTYKKGLFTNKGRDTWREITHSNLVNENLISKNYLISANDEFNNNNNIVQKDYNINKFHTYHKKSNGISCAITGEAPYHGALILVASGAMKTGCTYLHVFTNSEYAHSLPMIIPEIIAMPFSLSEFERNIITYRNILIGPGTNSITRKYVEIAYKNLANLDSLILDAGALNYLKKNNQNTEKLIITPHPGEAAKILNIKVSEVQVDRYNAAKMLFDMFNCIVILKGSGTIIYNGKNFYTCMDGNYKMAIAGMGDMLSGILLSEMAQNENNLDACVKSITFHSYASDYLYSHATCKHFMPSDIPDTYNELLNK
tara:strand:- start:14844 stop:16307 length:1464 start_codon:yes stop_codon:yes gene_type:complete